MSANTFQQNTIGRDPLCFLGKCPFKTAHAWIDSHLIHEYKITIPAWNNYPDSLHADPNGSPAFVMFSFFYRQSQGHLNGPLLEIVR